MPSDESRHPSTLHARPQHTLRSLRAEVKEREREVTGQIPESHADQNDPCHARDDAVVAEEQPEQRGAPSRGDEGNDQERDAESAIRASPTRAAAMLRIVQRDGRSLASAVDASRTVTIPSGAKRSDK